MSERKLCPGECIADFKAKTLESGECGFSDIINRVSGKTALVFLRFFGCRLTKYDLMQYREHIDEITEKGQLVVVLQSDPDRMREALAGEKLPFEVICDPSCKLYDDFGVAEAADDIAAFKDDITKAKVKAFLAAGIESGEVEGRHLQAPAVFVVDNKGMLTDVRYGVSAGDAPTVAELVSLLK